MTMRRAALAILLGGCTPGAGTGDGSSDESTGSSGDGSASITTTNATTPTTTTGSMSASGTATTTSTTTSDTADSTGDATTSEGSSSDDTTTGTASCDIDPLAPDTYVGIELMHDGVMRTYNLYVPMGFTGEAPLPLVLNFHGFTSNAAQQQAFSLFDATADSRGLAVAYPEGLNNSWNAGACCGVSADTDVDDVGFVLAVVADIQTRLCIDPQRVYATGMSNGGFLSHRLGCEAADTFAAIAPVAGVLGIAFEECNPTRPVPVMHFHGTADPLVPYDGNGLGFPSVADTIAQWVMHDGCTGDAQPVFEMDDAHCEAWDECEGDAHVELCTVENGGHCWPGNTFCPLSYSTDAISASDRMADFFLEHSLP
ncbi:MAG TPA: PHB depolymerase family esterase [Nannocystaceae bacterium]|nr:PHB depolymerase family esterase [Nannocystaceae bacterium]